MNFQVSLKITLLPSFSFVAVQSCIGHIGLYVLSALFLHYTSVSSVCTWSVLPWAVLCRFGLLLLCAWFWAYQIVHCSSCTHICFRALSSVGISFYRPQTFKQGLSCLPGLPLPVSLMAKWMRRLYQSSAVTKSWCRALGRTGNTEVFMCRCFVLLLFPVLWVNGVW